MLRINHVYRLVKRKFLVIMWTRKLFLSSHLCKKPAVNKVLCLINSHRAKFFVCNSHISVSLTMSCGFSFLLTRFSVHFLALLATVFVKISLIPLFSRFLYTPLIPNKAIRVQIKERELFGIDLCRQHALHSCINAKTRCR